jgi:divalent metal cation (Fe/Co/Zn/Cd) transporter
MNNDKYWRIALILGFITIFYNIAEGVVSILFGLQDETLTLLGFGIDSFVEVISGIGVVHMVMRIRKNGDGTDTPRFERNALRITGTAFYLLTVGLVAGIVINLIQGAHPATTIPGAIISTISLLTMFALMRGKMVIGAKLNSDAVIADARCTLTCIYLSIVLLVSSLLYEFLKIPYIDAAGSLGIAFFAFREGREALGKAAGKKCGCGHDDCETEKD